VAIMVAAVSVLFLSGGAAEAAKSPVSGNVIDACLKTKGKPSTRGTLRVVSFPRACKKKRGERATVQQTASKACTQANAAATQVNAVAGVLGGLTLSGIVGGLLNVPKPPALLPTVSC
jgi:hypothetical protein